MKNANFNEVTQIFENQTFSLLKTMFCNIENCLFMRNSTKNASSLMFLKSSTD